MQRRATACAWRRAVDGACAATAHGRLWCASLLCVDDGGRAEVGGSSGTEVRDVVVCGGAGVPKY